MSITLRPYQATGVVDIRNACRTQRRILYVLPTGGGKTVMFTYLSEQAAKKGNSVWICVNRKFLVAQTCKALDLIGVPHGTIEAGKGMDFSYRVQVCSIDTLSRRVGCLPVTPDIIIIDEAHHTPAKTWNHLCQNIGAKLFIGFTATPERLDGKGLNQNFEMMVRGPSTADLMRLGYLSKCRYFAPGTVDMTSVRRLGGDFNRSESEAIVDKNVITGDAVEHYTRLAAGQPAIVFCVTIAHAKHVTDAFRSAGYAWDCLSSDLNATERAEVLHRFETGKTNGMCAVDMVSEGFDLPAVSVGIMLRPTNSLGMHLQQLGRILRPVYSGGHDLNTQEGRLESMKNGNKPFAILLDHVGNTARHGFAEFHREWSLVGGAMAAMKKKEGDPADRIAVCPSCFSAHMPAPKCPYCGHEYESRPHSIKQVEGELVAVDTDLSEGLGNSLSGKPFVPCVKCGKPHVEGVGACPHCGHNYEAARKTAIRIEQGSARDFEALVAVGEKRGFTKKNAKVWAYHILKSRQKKKGMR